MKGRPFVSQMVIDEFAKVIDLQDSKGYLKYGKTIDDALHTDWNWPLMALEEAADLQKYLVKEIVRLKQENQQLVQENEQIIRINQYLAKKYELEGSTEDGDSIRHCDDDPGNEEGQLDQQAEADGSTGV
ncbi:hypothetical protein V1498_06725 [Peribacillus sp. SCS-26]|uniref:hypothetical protein n=1 Tax=Paraperibacillus marinus TaxID=3115295 RepID=UPI0039065FA6